MIFYYCLYFLLAFKSIEETRAVNTFKKSTQNFLIIFLSLLIGLRYQVGCDWDQYEMIFGLFRDGFSESWNKVEPSFALINSIFSKFEFGIYFVNLFCAVLFSYCLIKFCKSLPRPWLGLCVAYPYLIMVVAMGYTRQSVSIALSLLAFLALEKGQFYKSIFYILLGITFHRSGAFFLFAPLLYTFQNASRFNNFLKLIIMIILGYYFIDNFVLYQLDVYRIGYLSANLSSSGSLIRIILCVIPSLIFIFNLNKFKISKIYKNIFIVMTLLSIISLVALRFSPSSTAIDRLALNILPIQIFVASYIPDLGIFNLDKFTWKFLIILSVFIILSVWLIFATHAFCWIPYRNIIYQL
tara:strand:+ start:657 stop:1718 length:1062 start_codon:yes stop_codon:yes gene_type:complete